MRQKQEKITLIVSVLTVLLIFYRDMVNNSLPFFCFSAICALGALYMGTPGRFLYITALLPFCRGIPYSEMILIVLVEELILVVLPQRKLKGVPLYVSILMICVVELLSYLRFDTSSLEIIYLLAYMLFVTYAVSNKVYLGLEVKYVCFYGVATVLAVISVVIREVGHYGWDHIFLYSIRFEGYIEGKTTTGFNANELGLYCAMAMALFLTIYHHTQRLLHLLGAVTVSLLGLLSVSRTFLLVIILAWLVFLVANRMRFGSILTAVGIIAATILVVAVFAPNIMDWLFNFFADRFGEENTRGPLLFFYFDKVFSDAWSTFFGFSQGYMSVLKNYSMSAVHNGPQEVLVCWGIVGSIFFIMWVAGLYRFAIRGDLPTQKMNYLVVVIFWLFIQTLQLITMHNYLIVMFLSMIAISIGGEQQCLKRCRN